MRKYPAALLVIVAAATALPAAAPDNWSAIAYSAALRADGYSFQQPTREAAEAAARTACSESGATDCEIVGSGQQCLVLTLVPVEKVAVHSLSPSEAGATAREETCEGRGHSPCPVLRNVCAASLPQGSRSAPQ